MEVNTHEVAVQLDGECHVKGHHDKQTIELHDDGTSVLVCDSQQGEGTDTGHNCADAKSDIGINTVFD